MKVPIVPVVLSAVGILALTVFPPFEARVDYRSSSGEDLHIERFLGHHWIGADLVIPAINELGKYGAASITSIDEGRFFVLALGIIASSILFGVLPLKNWMAVFRPAAKPEHPTKPIDLAPTPPAEGRDIASASETHRSTSPIMKVAGIFLSIMGGMSFVHGLVSNGFSTSSHCFSYFSAFPSHSAQNLSHPQRVVPKTLPRMRFLLAPVLFVSPIQTRAEDRKLVALAEATGALPSSPI